MRLHLHGVRGSTPAPGAEFVRVGGDTSCVAVTTGADLPTIVLDAGTGLRKLTEQLRGEPFRGTLLLTHLHWDHTQGLPFFAAGDRSDARVDVVVPAQHPGETAESAAELMSRAMSPPHFPIGPDGLLGEWTWRYLDVGRSLIGETEVEAFEVPHKGGRTFGYRLEDVTGSAAYIPDHQSPRHGPDPSLVECVRGVDVLLHDAQFFTEEIDLARAYGHSTVDQAVDLAIAAEVGQLVLFHHGPGRTDDDVDRIEASAAAAASAAGSPLAVITAREGTVIDPATATVRSWSNRTSANL
ncbi:MAG TPA: MBL fold metallo-hydrolase [Microthrixaceae bacterium]|nr:MBL fold metallo-hydrolase [Microthrixaceae bacterium]